MLKGVKKDIRNRKIYQIFELNRNISKFFIYSMLNSSLSISKKEKFLLFFNKSKNVHIMSKTKIVRRCVFNNRGRGSLRLFGISRSFFRDLLLQGLIPGYTKSVW